MIARRAARGPCPSEWAGAQTAKPWYHRLMAETSEAHVPTVEDLKRMEAIFHRVKIAEAQCLIGPQSECDEHLVEAHFVQKAKLRLISNKYGRVYSTIPDMKKSIAILGAKEITPMQNFIQYRSISSPIMTGKWACSHHDDKTFSLIEKNAIDPENEEHCLLLAYRATLFNHYQKHMRARYSWDLFVEFSERRKFILPHFLSHYVHQKISERFNLQVKHALQCVQAGQKSGMEHRRIYIHRAPRLVATIVTMRGGESIDPPNEIKRVEQNRILVPAKEIPLIVTVYPEADGHVAVLSFPQGWSPFVRNVIPAFWEEKDDNYSALISKTILEETENIMISPSAWESFGDQKKQRILRQFSVTIQPDLVLMGNHSDVLNNIPDEDISDFLYRRDPDFVDNSDPEEFNLFSD